MVEISSLGAGSVQKLGAVVTAQAKGEGCRATLSYQGVFLPPHSQEVFLVPVLQHCLAALTGRPEWMEDLRWQQGWLIPDMCQGRQGAELSFLLFSGTIHSCLALFFHPLLPRGLFEGGSLSCAYLQLVLAEGKNANYLYFKAGWKNILSLFLVLFFISFHCWLPGGTGWEKNQNTITDSSNIQGLLVFGSNLEMERDATWWQRERTPCHIPGTGHAAPSQQQELEKHQVEFNKCYHFTRKFHMLYTQISHVNEDWSP